MVLDLPYFVIPYVESLQNVHIINHIPNQGRNGTLIELAVNVAAGSSWSRDLQIEKRFLDWQEHYADAERGRDIPYVLRLLSTYFVVC